MKGLKKQRRIQLLLMSMLLLTAAASLIGYAMRDGISYFRSPVEVLDNPPDPDETFRLGGLVTPGGITLLDDGQVELAITDGEAGMRIVYEGILPDMIVENQGVIATGSMVDGLFVAQSILAKHDEKYLPREVADALKERGVFQQPLEE